MNTMKHKRTTHMTAIADIGLAGARRAVPGSTGVSSSVRAIHELPLHESDRKENLPKGWVWKTLGEMNRIMPL